MNAATRKVYGMEIGPSNFGPRGVVEPPETSSTGNVILRAGNEHGGSWQQAAHIVLTPDEAEDLARRILGVLDV